MGLSVPDITDPYLKSEPNLYLPRLYIYIDITFLSPTATTLLKPHILAI